MTRSITLSLYELVVNAHALNKRRVQLEQMQTQPMPLAKEAYMTPVDDAIPASEATSYPTFDLEQSLPEFAPAMLQWAQLDSQFLPELPALTEAPRLPDGQADPIEVLRCLADLYDFELTFETEREPMAGVVHFVLSRPEAGKNIFNFCEEPKALPAANPSAVLEDLFTSTKSWEVADIGSPNSKKVS